MNPDISRLKALEMQGAMDAGLGPSRLALYVISGLKAGGIVLDEAKDLD